MTLRQRRLVVNAPRSVGIDRLVDGSVELEQVLEDLTGSQVLRTVRPLVIVYHFLALVNQRPAHIEELLPRQRVLSVVDRAGRVLDARHLEQLVRMRRYTSTG